MSIRNNASFRLDELDSLIDWLDELRYDIIIKLRTVERRLNESCKNIYELNLQFVNDYTGDLKANAVVESEQLPYGFIIEIRNDSPHAIYVEFGTGKYRGRTDTWYVHESMFPRGRATAEYYNFEERGDSGVFVVHGQYPKQFFYDTYMEVEQVVKPIFEEVFRW